MKVLCIGNNTADTDVRTEQLALDNNSQSHGLISELDGPLPELINNGYYHTSVYDIEYNRLLDLARGFDQVIVLDQPKEQYSHPDAFYQTIRLANELGTATFQDPTVNEGVNFFEELVKTNKSFCIFPFIEVLANNGITTVCCRSYKEVTRLSELKDFCNDPKYTAIRNQLLTGESIPDHCSACYQLEDRGIVSPRIQETVEWANRLDLKSLEDLQAITSPAYYEIRPSNICNLQCRTCNPHSSHLIAREYTQLKLVADDFSKFEYVNFDYIDFTNVKKIYVAGGEPTAMTEFYEFLDRCIVNGQTNFELLINTNGTKLSDRFKQQLKHFKTVSFIVSIDGFGGLNHYIRWPSDWDRIIQNVEYLCLHYPVSFNITVSIYNILRLNELVSYLEYRFPRAVVHCQSAHSPEDTFSALNFPYPELLIDKLTSIQNLNCYKNDRLLSSFINSMIKHYADHPVLDLSLLKQFFKFNDRLDQSRNIQLADYIPELELARQLIQSTD